MSRLDMMVMMVMMVVTTLIIVTSSSKLSMMGMPIVGAGQGEASSGPLTIP